jgi:hypothetical protein
LCWFSWISRWDFILSTHLSACHVSLCITPHTKKACQISRIGGFAIPRRKINMKKTLQALLAICTYRQLEDAEILEYITNVIGREFKQTELEKVREK